MKKEYYKLSDKIPKEEVGTIMEIILLRSNKNLGTYNGIFKIKKKLKMYIISGTFPHFPDESFKLLSEETYSEEQGRRVQWRYITDEELITYL